MLLLRKKEIWLIEGEGSVSPVFVEILLIYFWLKYVFRWAFFFNPYEIFSFFLFLTVSKWKLLVLDVNWAQVSDNMLIVSHTMAAI